MRVLRDAAFPLLLLMFVAPGLAQSPEPSEPAPADADSSQSPPPVVRQRVHPTPCWRQAGMAPELVNQRWKLEDQGKTRIAAVCSEPSLSAQQKHDKIQEIHAETDQAILKLIPSKQLQAFNACQAELDKKRPKPQKELGPCGGVIPATPSTTTGAQPHPDHH